MGWESMNVTGNWNGSSRVHTRANRTRSGTVPLRSYREVVGSFLNDRTQWNRCEHGCPVAFRNGSGPKALHHEPANLSVNNCQFNQSINQSINQSTLFWNITSIYKFRYAIKKTKLTDIISTIFSQGGITACIGTKQ